MFLENPIILMNDTTLSTRSPYQTLPISLSTICSFIHSSISNPCVVCFSIVRIGCASACSLFPARHPSVENAPFSLVELVGLLPSGLQSRSAPDLNTKICRSTLLDCPEHWLHQATAFGKGDSIFLATFFSYSSFWLTLMFLLRFIKDDINRWVFIIVKDEIQS